jgi:predicted alpha-1,6-mannanase (GH76 family)
MDIMNLFDEATWARRADIAQRSLDHYFGVAWPQYLQNSEPAGTGETATFNYWWLAHVIDVRLDAWERTGTTDWVTQAERAYENIVERNGGVLFNDYFDDMLWFGLAILRLHEATGEDRYLDEAVLIWDHVIAEGWNETLGASLAWRKQQLQYKNMPANGPLVILSLRLERALPGDVRNFRTFATTALTWLESNLIGPDGFVEDGVNREGDGRVDKQWRFTYNQGLYIGANVELFRSTGDQSALELATRTALLAISELSDGEVFREEGAGGDEGLFKGIYYRYLGGLIPLLPVGDQRAELERFLRVSTDELWRNAFRGEWIRAGNNWSLTCSDAIPYSTQLSAIMALEQRVRLERNWQVSEHKNIATEASVSLSSVDVLAS